jgi:hypothetical protein
MEDNNKAQLPAESEKPKKSSYKLIKKRSSVVMPKAKYDGAFEKENPYYIKIANRYAILKYISILLTFVFAVTMLTAYSADITPENFQYLLKDLDITGVLSGSKFDSVIYNGGSTSSFGIYRGELAVINAGSTMLYKPSGALSYSDTNKFYNPRLEISEKYMLIYDRGDTTHTYSVHNSFAKLHEERFDYPITLAEMSNKGSYAVVTRDDSFRSIVYIYNENFNLKNTVKKDKYVLTISMNDAGNKLAIASVYDKDGAFESEIQVIGISSKTPDFTVTESEKIPLESHWLKNGDLAVVFSDSTIIYSPKGEKRATLDLSGLSSHNLGLSSSLIVSVYNTTVLGYDKTVNIYDHNAELIITASLEGELIRILPGSEKVCLLFEDRAVLIDVISKTVLEAPVKPNAKDIAFYEDTVIVCYSGGAEPLDFGK